jgi:hypothetical protein
VRSPGSHMDLLRRLQGIIFVGIPALTNDDNILSCLRSFVKQFTDHVAVRPIQ